MGSYGIDENGKSLNPQNIKRREEYAKNPIKYFNWNKKYLDKLKEENFDLYKNRKRKSSKEYYQKNKDSYQARKDKYKREIRDFISLYKSIFGCAYSGCDCFDPDMLDFHHPENNKELNIADSLSLKKVLNEIEKCIVLCANHHKETHFFINLFSGKLNNTKNKKTLYRKYLVNSYKEKNGCIICGENKYYMLQFHHTGDKKFNISNGVNRKPIKEIIEEISKCVVICDNHHRKLHRGEA